ncbi:MAG: YvcK family protein [Atopobiaceae bacterium]|jgi:uncharacterized cofD-like protein|nr:YvcK family protein [Atopobiaceae bacterium]MCI2172968.1 YvcK family protein [Atopobiaceae bacterium]MCI2208373.1 YvcK family protein [Atopobiaceae bacterium]
MADHLRRPRPVSAVCVGGGTGQPCALRALRTLGYDLTAVVAMADDGGSTGRLRDQTGTIPPGDVRKCLVALADDPEGAAARAFGRRLPEADRHALGNLVISTLSEECGSFPEAVSICERWLGCVGHVLPSTLESVTLAGETRDGRLIEGQAALSHGPCTLSHAWLEPEAPAAYRPAVDAILSADLVVIGPGSLYTSIIPNLLVPDVAQAIRETHALRMFVCPKADTQGETWGLAADEYVDALEAHGLARAIDVVLLHRRHGDGGVVTRAFHALTADAVEADAAHGETYDGIPLAYTRRLEPRGLRAVEAADHEVARIEDKGIAVRVADFDDGANPFAHDVGILADTISGVMGCRSLPR